jgi:hypothetical protein
MASAIADLGDGLTLRRATPADGDALVAFTAAGSAFLRLRVLASGDLACYVASRGWWRRSPAGK